MSGFAAALAEPEPIGACIGATAFASSEALEDEAGSLATAGTMPGVAAGGGGAGGAAFGFCSDSFFAETMLMSATLSFWMRANPYEVSTRNESFSKPTMVPTILVPSFRRISSARAAPAATRHARRVNAGIDLPRMVSSMAKPGIVEQGSAEGKFPLRHWQAENFKCEISDLGFTSLVCWKARPFGFSVG
ncbi:MAG TPA: hypothetical protein VH598_11390 [Verrucomicrobiae bacterium]|nr:hypothetical protein [Verrucomicrobiae bacterium]